MEKSIIRVVGEGTLWASSSTVIVKILSFTSIFLILSQLGVSEYGILELVLSITTLLSIFMLPGLDALVVADMGVEKGRGEPGSARMILGSFLTLQLMFATVGWALLFFGASLFAHLYSVPPHYVHTTAFFFLLAPLRAAYGILFRVNLQFQLQSLLSVLEEGIKLILLGVLFFVSDLGVFKLLFIMLSSQSIALLILFPYFLAGWRSLAGEPRTTLPWWGLLTGHGKWGILSTYVGNLGKSIRLWILQRMLGAEAVGIYAVAIGLIGHTAALAPLYSIISSMLPQFVHDRARFIKLFNKGVKYQFLAYVVLGFFAFAFFPPFLTMIFPRYQDAFPLFQLMLLSLLPSAVTLIINPVFTAFRLQKSLFMSNSIKALMTVVFTYIGVALFGIWGVVFESLLTSVFQAVERLWSLRRQMPGITISRSSLTTFDDEDRIVLKKIRTVIGRVSPLAERIMPRTRDSKYTN